MTVRNRPNYGIFPLQLSSAGFMDLPVQGTRLIFLGAWSGAAYQYVANVPVLAGGTPDPNAILNFQIGKSLGDPIPLGINGQINVEDAFEFVRISWAAQAGVTAFVLIDDDRQGAGVVVNAPAAVLGGAVDATIAQGGNTALVSASGGLQIAGPAGADSDGHFGGSTASVNAAGAGATTVVAPASNVRGIWVRGGLVAGTSSLSGALFAASSAPTGIFQQGAFLISDSASVTMLPYPRFIPAGLGLYFYSTGSGPSLLLDYDIL